MFQKLTERPALIAVVGILLGIFATTMFFRSSSPQALAQAPIETNKGIDTEVGKLKDRLAEMEKQASAQAPVATNKGMEIEMGKLKDRLAEMEKLVAKDDLLPRIKKVLGDHDEKLAKMPKVVAAGTTKIVVNNTPVAAAFIPTPVGPNEAVFAMTRGQTSTPQGPLNSGPHYKTVTRPRDNGFDVIITDFAGNPFTVDVTIDWMKVQFTQP